MQTYPNNPTQDYDKRVEALEAEGLTTSDAQAVVDAEIMEANSTRHTPGRWIYDVEDNSPDCYTIKDLIGGNIAEIPRNAFGEGNANLIAAAPDLLEALELALKHAVFGYSHIEKQVIAAIAKAKGTI